MHLNIFTHMQYLYTYTISLPYYASEYFYEHPSHPLPSLPPSLSYFERMNEYHRNYVHTFPNMHIAHTIIAGANILTPSLPLHVFIVGCCPLLFGNKYLRYKHA